MVVAKRRILILTRALPFHHLGGMEAVAWDTAKSLSSQGHQVTILTTPAPTLRDGQVLEGVTIRVAPAPQGKYSNAWNKSSVHVYDNLDHRPDVVLSISAAGFALARKIRASGAEDRPKLVMQAHGTSWGEFISKWKTGEFANYAKSIKNIIGIFGDFHYRQFDAVVGVGEAVVQDMKRWPTKAVIGRIPIYLINNGIDQKAFQFDVGARRSFRERFGISSDAQVILSASRLHRQKGIAEALRGFALLQVDNANRFYLIAGSGPDEINLKRLCDELNVSSRVKFVGRIDRHELSGFLSAGDLFVFTSLRVEGLPLNVLEALANGLVPITSSHLSSQGFPAIAVAPADSVGVSEKMREELETIKDRGSDKLPLEFNLQENAKKYSELFERLG